MFKKNSNLFFYDKYIIIYYFYKPILSIFFEDPAVTSYMYIIYFFATDIV